jgi:hypothetical protein
MKQLKRFQWNHQATVAWLKKALIQLVPVALIYLTPIIADLSTVGHVFSLQDFIPTNFTLGAMVLYILNRIYDALQRWVVKK